MSLGKKGAALLACLAACWFWAPAFAASLQVSPVTVNLQARQNSEGLWLSNSGAQPLQAQVRVYAWVQENGEDLLKPTSEMVVSPPMLTIQPGQRQIVRLVRVGAGQMPPATEKAYRVVMDELPVGAGGEGVQFVLRYSVPVFVAAPTAHASTNGQPMPAPPLQWSLQDSPAGLMLSASNLGQTRAKITQASLVGPNGKRTVLSEGLYGYVLPGRVRHWALEREAQASAQGGTLDLSVNEQVFSVPLQAVP